MKLILLENVANLGAKGEEVVVKEGYGRNYLIPNGLAVVLSDSRAKNVKNELVKKGEEKEQKIAKQHETAKEIEGKELVFNVKADKTKLFASIGAEEIAKKLENISAKQVILKDPIKELGEYKVKIKINEEITSDIVVKIVKE